MAQADTNLDMRRGTSTGSLDECQRCGHRLDGPTEGTDPDNCDALGGFIEQYECPNCGGAGKYRYRYKDGKQAYQGVCADYQ